MAGVTCVNTRRFRFFIYHDGKNVVFGKELVRYEPDPDKNIFGSCAVEIYFPKRREAKHSFRLDLYPQVNEKHPEENIIDDIEEGCRLLFLEANRSAGLQTRSICGISREDLSYKNFSIVPIEGMQPFQTEKCVVSVQDKLKGVLTKSYGVLRKGDVVVLKQCVMDDEKRLFWACAWNPNDQKKTIVERLRKFFMKHFSCDKYRERYTLGHSLWTIPIDTVKPYGVRPFEKETDRDYGKEG